MADRPENALGKDSRLKRYDDVRDMIGDPDNPTPLVSLPRLLPPDSEASLYVKLEWMNPFGSVKDRAAKWMLEAMERRGELAGRTILEPTSGNTGIALAAMASLMGHPMVATVPWSMPFEKTVLMRALGAEVVPTPEGGVPGRHPMDVAMDMAAEMIEDAPGVYAMPNQYDNEDNVTAHYESTGPEVWAQTEGRIRYFFAGFGTTGTVTGVGRFLKERDPGIQVIAIEPVPGHRISGLKNLEETCVPGILDRSVIDEVLYVDDAEAREVARRLHREEALMVGSSGAAVVAGALRYLEGRGGVAVAIAPDSSQKAISYLAEVLQD
jgi:cysteinyl-tRNA synthetase